MKHETVMTAVRHTGKDARAKTYLERGNDLRNAREEFLFKLSEATIGLRLICFDFRVQLRFDFFLFGSDFFFELCNREREQISARPEYHTHTVRQNPIYTVRQSRTHSGWSSRAGR